MNNKENSLNNLDWLACNHLICVFNKIGEIGDIATYQIKEKTFGKIYNVIVLFRNLSFQPICIEGISLEVIVKQMWKRYLKIRYKNKDDRLFVEDSMPKYTKDEGIKLLTNQDMILIFKHIGSIGYDVTYKVDGPREKNKYVVLIRVPEISPYPFTCSAMTLEESILGALGHITSKVIIELGISGIDKLIKNQK